jgi:beta-N-acetylhexosaminidase
MSLRELRRHAGRLAVVSFSGHSVPADLRRIVAEFDLAGVIYFARNIVEPRQVADLSREVRSLAPGKALWISVDQEGGRVARLRRPFTEWPPMMTLGRALAGSASTADQLAERFAAALARELTAVGINLDYAPVLDIHTNPKNPVIGDRALAERAEDVSRLGRLIIRTLQAQGVAACGKHFPGHGDTSADSHFELPVVEHPPDRLDAVEFAPFRAAIAEGVATIMTAHVIVPALDGEQIASLSTKIVTGLLKTTLGYDGVVVSDDLGMKAVSATIPLPEATVQALAAGCDVVLMCNSTADEQVEALEAVIRAAETGRLSEARIDDALARQQRVRERLLAMPATPPGTLDRIGCGEHRAIADEMAAWL